mmetsp:Transcript_30283/g.65254  ORF Transcript_30283/g.65254 Transcript_30283/m.65254 type:complete len:418 (-) Transcript_30283:78-1331(-)
MALDFDLTARRERNLRVLQTVDENVIEIIKDHSHVAVYQFDDSRSKWERLDVEGSAFITRSRQNPLYSLIVLNKKGPDDFTLDLGSVEKLSLQPPYIMIRCRAEGSPVTFGVWLHNETELSTIYHLLVRISLNKETPNAPSSPAGKARQLMSVLRRKQSTVEADQIRTDEFVNPAPTTPVVSTAGKSAFLMSMLKSGPRSAPSQAFENSNGGEAAPAALPPKPNAAKAGQLLSILKPKSSVVQSPPVACAVTNIAPPVPPAPADRRAQMLLAMVKPRSQTVDDLLTDVDIAKRVQMQTASGQARVGGNQDKQGVEASSSQGSTASLVKQDKLKQLLFKRTDLASTVQPPKQEPIAVNAPIASIRQGSISQNTNVPVVYPPRGAEVSSAGISGVSTSCPVVKKPMLISPSDLLSRAKR